MEFGEYVARQRPALMRFATVLTCRTWLAEDLVSDVLGRAFERWDRISRLGEPHAYVRRMVVNEYLSWRRRLARCDLPGSPHCTVRDLPDGSSPATDRNTLEGSANGVTHMFRLHRADGISITMHVGNQRVPQGNSEQLGAEPPLTVEQLVEIATSDRW